MPYHRTVAEGTVLVVDDDPVIVNPQDAILKVKMSSVCGSDEHIIAGYIPTVNYPGLKSGA